MSEETNNMPSKKDRKVVEGMRSFLNKKYSKDKELARLIDRYEKFVRDYKDILR